MGMYDSVKSKWPLPVKETQDFLFQTKSLDCDLDEYRIEEDGSLWHEDYDVEDRSDKNAAPGTWASICGMITRVNPRWERCLYTGEIRFYTTICNDPNDDEIGWIEYSSYFVEGALKELHTLEYKPVGVSGYIEPPKSTVGVI